MTESMAIEHVPPKPLRAAKNETSVEREARMWRLDIALEVAQRSLQEWQAEGATELVVKLDDQMALLGWMGHEIRELHRALEQAQAELAITTNPEVAAARAEMEDYSDA